jgi:hypothetical protein
MGQVLKIRNSQICVGETIRKAACIKKRVFIVLEMIASV